MKTAEELVDATRAKREGREYRGDCPVHGGRSFCFREKDGRLVFVCRAGCSQGDVISALKKMGLWGNEVDQDRIYSPPPPEPPDDGKRRIERAEKIWDESQEITHGDPVHKYLTGRGIVIDTWPDDLHTHPALPYWSIDDNEKPVKIGSFPAMIGVVRNPQGRPVALHRTYLTDDGHKASVDSPKKILKVFDLAGSSVRLFTPVDGLLAITEGVEDALSAWVLWRIPTWACLGTSGMKAFEPPAGIWKLIVFADRDENGAGQKAALELAKKLKRKIAVSVRLPDGHKDLNALLMERATHAV